MLIFFDGAGQTQQLDQPAAVHLQLVDVATGKNLCKAAIRTTGKLTPVSKDLKPNKHLCICALYQGICQYCTNYRCFKPHILLWGEESSRSNVEVALAPHFTPKQCLHRCCIAVPNVYNLMRCDVRTYAQIHSDRHPIRN